MDRQIFVKMDGDGALGEYNGKTKGLRRTWSSSDLYKSMAVIAPDEQRDNAFGVSEWFQRWIMWRKRRGAKRRKGLGLI